MGCTTRDYTRRTAAICQIHGAQMEKTTVPVNYYLIGGYSKHAAAMNAVRASMFPNARDSVTFGRHGTKPDNAIIYTCLKCKQALLKWEQQQD